jgi:hypothetical protein
MLEHVELTLAMRSTKPRRGVVRWVPFVGICATYLIRALVCYAGNDALLRCRRPVAGGPLQVMASQPGYAYALGAENAASAFLSEGSDGKANGTSTTSTAI